MAEIASRTGASKSSLGDFIPLLRYSRCRGRGCQLFVTEMMHDPRQRRQVETLGHNIPAMTSVSLTLAYCRQSLASSTRACSRRETASASRVGLRTDWQAHLDGRRSPTHNCSCLVCRAFLPAHTHLEQAALSA